MNSMCRANCHNSRHWLGRISITIPLRQPAPAITERVSRRALIGLDNERANQMGRRRSHFYGRHAAETRPDWSESESNVVIGNADFGGDTGRNALAAHLFGATIYPRKAKALTIPARSESYGMRAREFEGLRLVWPEAKDYGWLEQKSDQGLRRA